MKLNQRIFLSPVIDLDYDMSFHVHGPELFAEKFSMLHEHGFREVYLVAPVPGNGDYSHAARVTTMDSGNCLKKSRELMGADPLAAVIPLAKQVGLKVIVSFKVYEGGGAFSVPAGATCLDGVNSMAGFGGKNIGLDPFVIAHPEYLSRRVSMEGNSQAVHEIVMTVKGEPDITGAEFFVSDNNSTYRRVSCNYHLEKVASSRPFVNAIGDPDVSHEEKGTWVVRLTGLDLDSPYIKIQLKSDAGLLTLPYSMIEAFDAEGMKIPVTVSTTQRDNGYAGYEFETLGPYYTDNGWEDVHEFGLARGKMEHLRGELVEGYEEVRQHWLNQIRHFMDLGCDGVDIRFQAHSSCVTDFIYYGFNEPILERYRQLHGEFPKLGDKEDYLRLMQVRGSYFLEFLTEARRLLHGQGKNLGVELQDWVCHPTLDVTFHKAGFWGNPKVALDWRSVIELCDDVVLKDRNFGHYDRHSADEIKDYAWKLGKSLAVHCYLQQGHDWNPDFLAAIKRDDRVSKIILYEEVWNLRERDGIIYTDEQGKLEWKFNAPEAQ